MLTTTPAFDAARADPNLVPMLLFRLTNSFGQYVFAKHGLEDGVVRVAGPYLADGSHLADGSIRGGADSLGVLGEGRYVESFGGLTQSLVPLLDNVLGAWQQTEIAEAQAVLKDWNGLLRRIACTQDVAGATGEYLLGYPGTSIYDFITFFNGVVQDYVLTRMRLSLDMAAE